MDLTDIIEVTEVTGENEINRYLNKGWKLLSIVAAYFQTEQEVFTVASLGRTAEVPPDKKVKPEDIEWEKFAK